MTSTELAALPVGSIILLDNEPGEIIRSGLAVEIMWPESKLTSLIDTRSKTWYDFIKELEAENV